MRAKILPETLIEHNLEREYEWSEGMIDCKLLEEVLKSESPFLVREGARQGTVEKILNPSWLECIPLAIRVLKDNYKESDEDNHLDAAKVLGKMAEYKDKVPGMIEAFEAHEAANVLREALTNESAFIRVYIASALWELFRDRKTVLAVYEDALRSENRHASQLAATLLGLMGDDASPAVDSLATALRGSDLSLAWHAAFALRKIGSNARPAISALESLLESPDKNLADEAQKALVAIRQQEIR